MAVAVAVAVCGLVLAALVLCADSAHIEGDHTATRCGELPQEHVSRVVPVMLVVFHPCLQDSTSDDGGVNGRRGSNS